MPHIRRVRIGFDPTTQRPIVGRDVIIGGKRFTSDVCDPSHCTDRTLILDAYAVIRAERDLAWNARRNTPGGVLFCRRR